MLPVVLSRETTWKLKTRGVSIVFEAKVGGFDAELFCWAFCVAATSIMKVTC